MIAFAVSVGILMIVAIMMPFFVGRGGTLALASAVESKEKLVSIQDAIVRRYIAEETDFQSKSISEGQWRQRQKFLINRFVDASRRLDHLSAVQPEGVR